MKGTVRIILICAFATCLLALNVHGQVSLFRLSYEIDDLAEDLAQKTETFRRLDFEVNQLKAPRRLEQKVNELALDLTLPKDIQVVRVAPTPGITRQPQWGGAVPDSFQARLTHFLGRWMGVAQAKTES